MLPCLVSLDLLFRYSSLIIFFMSLVSHRGRNFFYMTLRANKNISIMKDQIFSFHFCNESLWSLVFVHLSSLRRMRGTYKMSFILKQDDLSE